MTDCNRLGFPAASSFPSSLWTTSSRQDGGFPDKILEEFTLTERKEEIASDDHDAVSGQNYISWPGAVPVVESNAGGKAMYGFPTHLGRRLCF